MNALKAAIGIAWIVFWICWLLAAVGAKESTRRRRRVPLGGITILAVVLLVRGARGGSLAVHGLGLEAVGTALFLAGLALAIWARLHLGRNWGMPATERAEPELVTSGPYRAIRHPIYSGLLLAMLGSALAISLIGLIVVAVLGAYFYHSARVEEKNLSVAFPGEYDAYRAHTRMLIPFLL